MDANRMTNAFYVRTILSFAAPTIDFLPVDGWIRAFLALLVRGDFGVLAGEVHPGPAGGGERDQPRLDEFLAEHDLPASR
ncbi:hypothetical protein [Saccharopolyspora antimicrobica]